MAFIASVREMETQFPVEAVRENAAERYNTFVYCYGKQIHLEKDKARPCPDFVFKLNASVKWFTDDYRYNPEVVELNAQPIEPVQVNVHEIHFKNVSHFVESQVAIEKFNRAREEYKITFQQLELSKQELKNQSQTYEKYIQTETTLAVGPIDIKYKHLSMISIIFWELISIIYLIGCFISVNDVEKKQKLEAALERHRQSRRLTNAIYDMTDGRSRRNSRQEIIPLDLIN